MLKKIGLIYVLLISLAGSSQTTWEINAKLFVGTHTSVYDYDFGKLDKTIERATEFINSYNDSADKKVLADVYFLRAELQAVKFTRLFENKEDIGPDNKLFVNTEADYTKAIELCSECNCKYLQGLKSFYYENEFSKKGNQADSIIKSIGGQGEVRMRLGLGVSYYMPSNVFSGDICLLGIDKIRQKKQVHPLTKRKYRNCEYEYPGSFGFFCVGYERSLNSTGYQGFKVDPIWINYIFSVHPIQFLYAKNNDASTFLWRPEVGFSFASFSLNYAYQLNFNKSFGANLHLFSVKLFIPTINLDTGSSD